MQEKKCFKLRKFKTSPETDLSSQSKVSSRLS